ncbi:hypothetical protein ASPZODRAFT_126134 [Penicilliopsis zonata CBS 506.65]|uniref:Actin-like ATPase domain-containing protein n=1 Tax=Penicilliopsis zonata CBS 506.65 TaxID=1073090 RepID=A0A1L9S4P9_9EURO|nr:hypothetical protein ASPZODRAFT_126134 [Penicilliopsis zonata CBS 506.65]OJJ42093.1 hypothetical protein ASPZODRAFT_126134 [Penicilliopsis zonata CBS 506.65]
MAILTFDLDTLPPPYQALHKVIVGVDYGTTFTGVSFVNTSQGANNIHVIRTWPGPAREQEETWKTPSRIAYRSENPSIGGGDVAWGYQVVPKMKAYTWTKLLLDPQSSHISQSRGRDPIEDGLMKIPAFKADARDVCTDYLAEIYKYTISYLERRLTREVLRETTLEFWFTTPAIWSDKARHDTYQAASRAGFDSRPMDEINMITEPEAAAISTLNSFSKSDSNPVNIGDGLLICDCGGGTVDIITYLVTHMQPNLEFEELLVGTGGKCGSTYIDRNFHKWMSAKFGSSFDKMKFEKKGPGSHFMKDFEAEKRDFGVSGTMDKTFEIDLVMPGMTDSENYNSEDGVVMFTSADMKSFFQPVTDEIKRLLKDQLRQLRHKSSVKIKTLILVGGFGDSPWLNDTLTVWCGEQGITLMCPENPQASVVKGAALRGLRSVRPKKRKCRLHYGFRSSLRFREGIDPESASYICEWYGDKHCTSRLDWVIGKGDSIGPDDESPLQGLYHVHNKGSSLDLELDLYTCAADTPPEWYDSPLCHHVGTIHYSFKESDLLRFEQKRNSSDRTMWRLEYKLGFDLLADMGRLKFKILGPDDKEIGETSIDYK